MLRWLVAALSMASPLALAQAPALDLQLRQIDAIDVITIVAELRGTPLVAVRPAKAMRMDVARGQLTLADVRQRALNHIDMKVVQRGAVEVALPVCQPPDFRTLQWSTEQVSLYFPALRASEALRLMAELVGLELRADAEYPDADLIVWAKDQTIDDILVAIAAALHVELRRDGKHLEVRHLPEEPGCDAAKIEWMTPSGTFRRASPGGISEYGTRECARLRNHPASKEYRCHPFEAHPLSSYGFHGFIRLSARGATAVVYQPPGRPATLGFRGTLLSEEFVAVIEVEPEAAHLIAFEYRNGERLVAAKLRRVPTATGKLEIDMPDMVHMEPPQFALYTERYPLEEILFESMQKVDGKPVATIRDVNGRRYGVPVGHYIGRNDGKVSAIDERGIDLVEIVPDGAGGHRENPVRLIKGEWYEDPRAVLRRRLAVPVNDTPAQREFLAAALEGDTHKLAAVSGRGVAIDARLPDDERNALLAATLRGQLPAVRWLLAHGAKPDLLIGKNEVTALQTAVSTEDLAITRALVDAGADVNLVNGDLMSPLHLAVSLRNMPAVDLLLERGANVNAAMGDGRRALDLAIEKDSANVNEIIALLRTHGAIRGNTRAREVE